MKETKKSARSGVWAVVLSTLIYLLLAPPDWNGGRLPYALYNLGGVLMNLLTAALFGALSALCAAVPLLSLFFFAAAEGGVRLEAVISAQEPTLNPALFVDALCQHRPELAPDFAKFTRIETFQADMSLFR